MKPSTFVSQLATALAAIPLCSATGNHDDGGDSGCCKFTLSSEDPFACPAGQLEDGQIRLNGTYPTSTFCIGPDGGITDERGFGCIVTEPPTTQIQCDQGKAPAKGFSISPDNTLLYNGSPKFFACPATDTEWNIYVSPNFGQLKCTPITLKTSGCGTSKPPTSSCPAQQPPATVTVTSWQTVGQTITQAITQTITQATTQTVTRATTETTTCTVTETKTETTTTTTAELVTEIATVTDTLTMCSSSTSSPRHCSRCTKTPAAPTSNTTTTSSYGGCAKPGCGGGHGGGGGGHGSTGMLTVTRTGDIWPPISTQTAGVTGGGVGGRRGIGRRWLGW